MLAEPPQSDPLSALAQLLRERNAIDAQIAHLIRRPAERGHIGEFIAAAIFDIALEPIANNRAMDGRFRSGPLAGRSANIKFYGKLEWLLAMATADPPDFYLVLTGAQAAAPNSIGATRPLSIDHVHLFDSPTLHAALTARGCRIDPVATSVARHYWDQAELFPRHACALLTLDDTQRRQLSLFHA